ncbi:hypothetical protein BDR07DRAFT_1450527 [Suillus spraguei]|nr:hypothetical protein BDR07DRAFT_1450527 [Suillus spraguei]
MEQAEGCSATRLEIRDHHIGPSVKCPNCGLEFTSNLAIVDHLNDQVNSCWSHEPTYRVPVPPDFKQGDQDQEDITGQYHPKSGYLFGRGRNILQEMKDHDPDQKHRRAITSSYPFADQAEWQLAEFLHQRLTQTDINKFLKLDWFKTRHSPSFKSAKQLFGWIDALPSGLQWQSTTLEFINYTTQRPIELIWHDSLEVVKDIFANPIFSNHMMYDPHIVTTGSEREYSEFFTANRAFTIQNNLAEGATIILIILASDKTPITRMLGGLEMHPVLLTIGNIQSEVCMKAIAFDVHPDFQMLLHTRLFHKCMDMIFAKCKVATRTGEYMSDPMAQALLLSGVYQPFWRNWPYADPSSFLPGELLHTCHKYIGNHPLKWCKEVVGEDELDAHYKAHHKRVGTRHFGSGVSHISQITCREHHDIEQTIVTTIAGTANTTPDFVHAFCFLTEFIYQVQSPVHTDSSINAMVHSLDEFHRLKQVILDASAQRGKSGTINNFLILKMELFHSFVGSIRELSALIQFSADVSEWLLITHCKYPFDRTNRQASSFTLQVIQILNCDKTMQRFNLYTLLYSHGVPLVNAIMTKDNIVAETDPTLVWIARVLPGEQNRFHGPRSIHNHFLKGILSVEANATFHVTISPDQKSLHIIHLQSIYSLSDFGAVLTEYITWTCTQGSVKTWNKFHLQLLSTFQSQVVMLSQVVQAFLPSEAFPLGNCDAVLLQLSASNAVAKKSQILPRYLEDSPLLYVQYFQIIATPTEDATAGMYHMKHIYHQDGTAVTCAVELIPVYGSKMDRTITAANSMEICDEFYLNTFSDKEVFNTMHFGSITIDYLH